MTACSWRRLRPFPQAPIPCPNPATRADGPFMVCDDDHGPAVDLDERADLLDLLVGIAEAPEVHL